MGNTISRRGPWAGFTRFLHGRSVLSWLVPVLILVVWQITVQSGWLSTRILPSPWAVLTAGWQLLLSGELIEHIGASTARAATGFAIGGSIGFFFGLMNGSHRLAEDLFDTTLQMVRNVPHLALIPLVILWFGIGEEGKIFLVALGVFFPILSQHFPWNPLGAGGFDRNGALLRAERVGIVP